MNQKELMARVDNWFNYFNVRKNIHETEAIREKKLFELDEAYINKILEEIKQNFGATEEECRLTKLRILSIYEIKQEEGEALLSDYEHVDWYPRPNDQSRPFWDRYYSYLCKKNPEFASKENKLGFNTDAITNLLGDPKSSDPFGVRGLVMGDVQSGKTATYIGLICKAVDAGYKVIILLTGTTESLRRQTQSRVDEGFIGFNSEGQYPVGVGKSSALPYPRAMTSTQSDYTGSNIDKNTSAAISRFDNIPLVFVCKKNTKVLGKIVAGLRSLNTSSMRKTIDAPLLLIDDEADNASINTNKPEEDPTAINRNIRTLLKLFRQSSYVGFTATPFANVFITPNNEEEMIGDDLFPKHFIYSLKAPDNYVGPVDLFTTTGRCHKDLVFLEDDVENSSLFSHSHKKDWDGDRLFPSFYESIIAFCLANTIRDFRNDGENTHRSMLINMSRFIAVQKKIETITNDYLDIIRNTLKVFGKMPASQAECDPMIAEIHRVWVKHYQDKVEKEWEEVLPAIYKSISPIKVVVVNSQSASKLDYDSFKAKGLRVIAIGGLALSRGLTLEGLMTSYFYRNTSTYDVLMQMGRWFGYRKGYEDIMRIWIPPVSAKWYREIAEAIAELRKDITRMIALKKTPLEFGIRVRNDSDELGITALNKMRNAIDRIERTTTDFYGRVFETTYLASDPQQTENNWSLVDELSLHLPLRDENVSKPYFRNIPKKYIIDLLKRLIIPGISIQFDREQLIRFVSENNDPKLDSWDILFASRDKSDVDEENNNVPVRPVVLKNGLLINPLRRTCFLTNDGSVAVSGSRRRLGSRHTRFGLTKEEREKAENGRDPVHGTTDETYMAIDRNPLLIIYAITPDFRNQDHGGSLAWENYELLRKSERRSYPGFSIGIPTTTNQQVRESHQYKVNRDADYYRKAGFLTENGEESIEE